MCGCRPAAATMSDELQALVLPGRRQLDLLRREAADHRQSRTSSTTARCWRGSASARGTAAAQATGRLEAAGAASSMRSGCAARAAQRLAQRAATARSAAAALVEALRRAGRSDRASRVERPRCCAISAATTTSGLSHHPALIARREPMHEPLRLRRGAAHLVSGHSLEHHALEEELAAFTGPRARAAVLDRLHGEPRRDQRARRPRTTCVLADRWNHASLLDAGAPLGAPAAALSRTAMPPRAERRCALGREHGTAPARQCALIVTDGVFSMDGDVAPLRGAGRARARAMALR